MPVSPLCLVQDGLGPFVGTLNGVNVTAGNTMSIQLAAPAGVVDWYLQVTGTDETSTTPSLTSVNILTNKVTSPGTTVTFPMPLGAGRAYLFQSTVTGPGGPLTTTFTLYVLTLHGFRVGATGEQRETNATFGWAAILNPLIRSGAPVVRYDDGLNAPTLGANTVQEAIDILKAAVPPPSSGGDTIFFATLFGEYSGAVTPGFMEAPYLVTRPRVLTAVDLLRRVAGTSGISRVDVRVNGVSIFGLPVNMPQVSAGSGNYAFSLKLPSVIVFPYAHIEIVLEEAETYLAGPTPEEDGPEGLFVALHFGPLP